MEKENDSNRYHRSFSGNQATDQKEKIMKHIYWLYFAVAFGIAVFAMAKLFAAVITLVALATVSYLLTKALKNGPTSNTRS